MYLSYYKLNKKPFQISTDPSFLWLGEKNKKALRILKYGVMDDKGFLLLSGDVGTGKTTLTNAFVNSLGNEVIVARVSDPGLTNLGFMKYIAEMYKMETDFDTKGQFLILFTAFLEQAHKNNKKVLLIIDEAQHLADETLEKIRLLSNIEKQDKKLLNIFLVGQNEFNETLTKYKNRALRQRLAINYILYPFEPDETKACIAFRLAVAGSKKEIFTPEAIDAIHAISDGFPGIINIICDHALLLGYQEEQEMISEEIIRKCSDELNLTSHPLSHNHENIIDSNNDWLEDAELPPLTIEEIQKASRPLPSITPEPKRKIKRKPRRYRAIIPLLLAALFLSSFFVLKEGKLETISQLFANKYKKTIASILETMAALNIPTLSSKVTEEQPTSNVTSEAEIIISTPVMIVEPQQGLIKQDTGSIEITDMNDHKPQPKVTEQQLIEETPPPQDVELPVSIKTVTENNTTAPNELPKINLEDTKTDLEMLTQEPQPPVTKTTTLAENDLIKEQQTSPPPLAESTSKGIVSPSSNKKTVTKLDKPSLTPAKKENSTKDDPGAVIDWLIKSNQN